MEKLLDLDLILRSLMFCVALPTCAKGVYEIVIGARSRLRDEYKFAREFMLDLERQPTMHPFVLEKGYQALVGDSLLSTNEATYLLSLKDSPRALRDFVMGRKYLEHLPQKGNLQIDFKVVYRTRWPRLWRRTMYLTLAGLLWLLGFGPLVFSPELFKGVAVETWLPYTFGCIVIFLPNAFFSLKNWARIYRAEELVKNQQRHTQHIVTEVFAPRRTR